MITFLFQPQMEEDDTIFPVVLPRDGHLLDTALRRMPAAWLLDEPIPDKQPEAQEARAEFLAWWLAFWAFLEEEHAITDQNVLQLPYYGAELAVRKK
jgi:hypothetical protein